MVLIKLGSGDGDSVGGDGDGIVGRLLNKKAVGFA